MKDNINVKVIIRIAGGEIERGCLKVMNLRTPFTIFVRFTLTREMTVRL
jgi:hypothetical protein